VLPECCLKIDLIFLGEEYFLDLTPVYSESGELLYYTFEIEGEYPLIFNLVWVDGVWQIIGGDVETLYYSYESDICPVSTDVVWNNEYEELLFERFEISWDGCPNALPACCMFINLQFSNVWYHLTLSPVYNEADELLYYTFVVPVDEITSINMILGYANGIWYMINDDTDEVYATLETNDCPASTMADWVQLFEEPMFMNYEIVNVNCSQTLPVCCLSISAIFEGEVYTEDVIPVYDESDVLMYYQFTGTFRLYYYDGVWYMVENDILHYSINLTGCPGSSSLEWTAYSEFFEAFEIFSLDCQNEPDDDDYIDIPEKPDLYYCKHKNLMRKVRAGLADRVADMKDVERFGLEKCMDKWEHIIKDYLIIHAIQCAPYNEYTNLDEKCLIGKLTDKFNC
jgi:hypothetical protein